MTLRQPMLLLKRILVTWAGLIMLAPVSFCAEISLGDSDGQIENIVVIPILLSDATDMATMQVQVNYDPQLLLLNGVTNAPGSLGASYDLFYDSSEDGVINIILSRQDGLSAGSGVIATLRFALYSGGEPGTHTEVVIANAGLGDQYGGGLALAPTVTASKAIVWFVMSDTVDSDNDGLSDYTEQMINGSPDYDPNGTDTDINNPDTDGDEMLDGWEAINGLNPLLNDAAGNNDEDAHSNYEEWVAGTSPTNSNSVFRINDITSESNQSRAVIWWDSVNDRLYSVFSHTNLSTQWPTTPLYQIEGDGAPQSYTNTQSYSPQYFRLKVELSP